MTAADRFAQAAQERAEKAAELAACFLSGLPQHVTDRVFRMAWDEGHASGWHDVENYYVDLADIAATAYAAGKEAAK